MELDLYIARNSLLGTAIGDSLGLPYEGLAPGRGQKLMPFPLRQRLLGRKGSVSDDAVQSGLVLRSLILSDGNTAAFVRQFSRSLRTWFLSAPPGIGLATIKASLRLCLGVPPDKSGVISAGNGAAMRAPVIGAALHSEPDIRKRMVEASSRITHTHPDAVAGAQLVALAASLQAKSRLESFFEEANVLVPGWDWKVSHSPRGPTGYVVQTVNAAINICLEPGISFEQGIEKAVRLGGDTDTVAAIVGGILAAKADFEPTRTEWLEYVGWPSPLDFQNGNSTPSYLRLLGQHMTSLPAILLFGIRRIFP